MSKTSLSPPFKGLNQLMMGKVEGSLQGAEMENQKLEQKIEAAGKEDPVPLSRTLGRTPLHPGGCVWVT